jgi:hypothetical protein
MVARLGRLFETDPGLPEWAAIAIASALLGGLVWWLLGQVVPNPRWSLIIHGALAVLLLLRVSVPTTLLTGIFPSASTPGALAIALEDAIRLIRFGVPPVVPTPGVLAVVALLMWGVGSLFAWGASRGPTLAILLPSVILYLQFAVFDGAPAGIGWMTASGGMLALGISAPRADTAPFVPELNDPRRLEMIADRMDAAGHPSRVIAKVLGGNWMRLFGEVWG